MLLTCSSRMSSSVCLVARLPNWMTHHSPVPWPLVTQSMWKHSSGSASKYQETCLYATHTSTRICASQHTVTHLQESAEKHTHVCRELQSDSTCTRRRTRITDPNTNTHTLVRVHSGSETDRRGAAVTGAALLLIPIRIHSCCVLSYCKKCLKSG